MNPRVINRRSSIMVMSALLILLSALAAGCGGGGQDSQQDGSKGNASQQREEKKKKNAPEVKIALGTIVFHNPDTQRFTLRPSKGENMIFRYNKNTKITLDGEKAGPDDIEQKLQAKAEYIVKDDLNRVRELELLGKSGSGEEKTG